MKPRPDKDLRHIIARRSIGVCAMLLAFCLTTGAAADDVGKWTKDLLAPGTKPADRVLIANKLLDKGGPQGRKVLADALASQRKNTAVLTSIIACIKSAKDREFLVPLLELHAAPQLRANEKMRSDVRDALAQLRRVEGVDDDIAARISNDKLPMALRRDAIMIFGELRAWRQMGKLLAALDPKGSPLNDAVFRSLRQITRLDWGAERIADWQRLWKQVEENLDDGERATRIFLDRASADRIAGDRAREAEVLLYLDPSDLKRNLVALRSKHFPGVRARAAINLTALHPAAKDQQKTITTALIERLGIEKNPTALVQLITGVTTLSLPAGPQLEKVAGQIETASNPHPYSASQKRTISTVLVKAFGQLRHAPAVKRVIQMLARPWTDQDIQLAGIEALGSIGGAEAFDWLALRARDHRAHPQKQLQAIARALGSFPQAGEPLLALLGSQYPDVRSNAADSLALIGAKIDAALKQRVIAKLTAMLDAKAAEVAGVRKSVALALGAMGKNAACLSPLGNALMKDADVFVRRCAAEALGKLGLPEAKERFLVKAFKDPDAKVASEAWKSFKALVGGDLAKYVAEAKWYTEQRIQHPAQCFEVFLAEQKGLKLGPATAARIATLERMLAHCALRAGMRAEALSRLRPLHKKTPTDLDLRLWLGQALWGTRDPTEAAELATVLAGFENAPGVRAAWEGSLLRTRLEAVKEPKKARARINELKKHDPKLGNGSFGEAWKTLEAEIDKRIREMEKKPPKQPGSGSGSGGGSGSGSGKQTTGGDAPK